MLWITSIKKLLVSISKLSSAEYKNIYKDSHQFQKESSKLHTMQNLMISRLLRKRQKKCKKISNTCGHLTSVFSKSSVFDHQQKTT